MSFERINETKKFFSNLKDLKNVGIVASACANAYFLPDELPYLLDEAQAYLEDPIGENNGELCTETHVDSNYEYVVPKHLLYQCLEFLESEKFHERHETLLKELKEIVE